MELQTAICKVRSFTNIPYPGKKMLILGERVLFLECLVSDNIIQK